MCERAACCITSAIDMQLYLASKSPRRREILQQLGIDFLLLPTQPPALPGLAEVDETPLANEPAHTYVERVTLAKAEYGWQALLRALPAADLEAAWVLAADTTVVCQDEILGKPADPQEAAQILRKLAAGTHHVLTGMALQNHRRRLYRVSSSAVQFRALSEAEIALYIASGEALDKAGAYGIQGRAAKFVRHLEGSYTGVMGLAAYELEQMLKAVDDEAA